MILVKISILLYVFLSSYITIYDVKNDICLEKNLQCADKLAPYGHALGGVVWDFFR